MAVGLTVDIASNAKALSSGFKRADRDIELFGKEVSGKLGKAFRLGGIGLAAGFTAGAAGITKLINDIDAASKVLVTTTGATGQALKGLEQDVRTVAGSVPQGTAEIAGMVGALNNLFDVSGSAGQEMAVLALNFNRLAGVEGADSINKIASAMRLFGVEAEDMDDTLGDIIKASQEFNVDVGALTSGLQQYTGTFAALGFNMEETIALMGQFERAGVPISKIGEGLAQFIPNVLKAGGDVRTEFERWIRVFAQGEEAAFDFTEAVKFFGAESINALIEAAPHLDLSAELGNNTGLVNDLGEEALTVGERFAIVGNQVETLFIPVAEALIPVIEDIAERAQRFVEVWDAEGLGAALKSVLLPTLGDLVSSLWDAEGAVGVLTSGLIVLGGVKVALSIAEIAANIAEIGTAAAAAGGGITGLKTALGGLGVLLGPVGIASAVVIGGILTVKHWDDLTDAIENAAEAVGGFAQDLGILPEAVTVSVEDVHVPEVAGGRFGGVIRERRLAAEAAEAEATARRAVTASLIDQKLFDQGQFTATAQARQDEAKAVQEAKDALAEFERAVQASKDALVEELGLRNLRGQLTPEQILEQWLDQDEFAHTAAGLEEFRKSLEDATDDAEESFKGLVALAADASTGTDPEDEDAKAAALAALETNALLAELAGQAGFDEETTRIVTAIDAVRHAVNVKEFQAIVGGALSGFGPGPVPDGAGLSPEEIQAEAERRNQEAREREFRAVWGGGGTIRRPGDDPLGLTSGQAAGQAAVFASLGITDPLAEGGGTGTGGLPGFRQALIGAGLDPVTGQPRRIDATPLASDGAPDIGAVGLDSATQAGLRETAQVATAVQQQTQQIQRETRRATAEATAEAQEETQRTLTPTTGTDHRFQGGAYGIDQRFQGSGTGPVAPNIFLPEGADANAVVNALESASRTGWAPSRSLDATVTDLVSGSR